MTSKIIDLKGGIRIKDGGSEKFRDEDGNIYYMNYCHSDRNSPIYGKLCKADKKTLAKGTFRLNKQEIITQP